MQENMGASIILWSVDPPDSLRSLPREGPTGGQAKTPLSYKTTISQKNITMYYHGDSLGVRNGQKHIHERPSFHLRYDPGPKPLSPKALSTTFIISITFSSSQDFPAICTPTGNPAIVSTSYIPPLP